MPSLERFFSPSVRFFDANIKSLPGSKLYFFATNSTTPKATFADKAGVTPSANPVVADSQGIFPPIFLSGLYRAELRSAANIVQPGWPIDNVGQDSTIAPFAPWSEIVTYQTDDVVTSPDGFWFRSTIDDNVGLDPDDNPTEWELIVIPIAANFTSDQAWATWSDSGTQLSLDIDQDGMAAFSNRGLLLTDADDLEDLGAIEAGATEYYYWETGSQPANVPVAGAGFAERRYYSATEETLSVRLMASNEKYVATESAGAWSAWGLMVKAERSIDTGRGLAGGGDLTADRTIDTYPFSFEMTGDDSIITENFNGTYWQDEGGTHTVTIGAQASDEGATTTNLINRSTTTILSVELAGGVTAIFANSGDTLHQHTIPIGGSITLKKITTNVYVVEVGQAGAALPLVSFATGSSNGVNELYFRYQAGAYLVMAEVAFTINSSAGDTTVTLPNTLPASVRPTQDRVGAVLVVDTDSGDFDCRVNVLSTGAIHVFRPGDIGSTIVRCQMFWEI